MTAWSAAVPGVEVKRMYTPDDVFWVRAFDATINERVFEETGAHTIAELLDNSSNTGRKRALRPGFRARAERMPRTRRSFATCGPRVRLCWPHTTPNDKNDGVPPAASGHRLPSRSIPIAK